VDDSKKTKSIAERISLAKTGDRESAFDILEIIYDSLLDHELPDRQYLHYLADCLMPIIYHGTDANIALHIKRKKGQRHTRQTLERDRSFTIEIFYSLDCFGLTLDEAIEKIRLSEKKHSGLDIGEEVIRKAYFRHREWADNELRTPIFKPEEKSREEPS